MKYILKKLLPEQLIRFLTGIIYGWHGNYAEWSDAKSKCSGYDSTEILHNVKTSALKVKDGTAVYERDSFTFDEVHYSFPLLSALMWIAA